ncbi:hypothetical protein COO60DRAFT_465697 [Scenedesmus sp. NREL 46B-D3]|nr:hypothetical protein COO60DRAFT_465697 [Scenedesmus sp. NREL 46B-D3]
MFAWCSLWHCHPSRCRHPGAVHRLCAPAHCCGGSCCAAMPYVVHGRVPEVARSGGENWARGVWQLLALGCTQHGFCAGWLPVMLGLPIVMSQAQPCFLELVCVCIIVWGPPRPFRVPSPECISRVS